MDESMDTAMRAGQPAGSGWGFAAGLLVGVAGALGGLALAVAAERRRRRRQTGEAISSDSSLDARETQDWQVEQPDLDAELAQTFPASDPLPQSHRID